MVEHQTIDATLSRVQASLEGLPEGCRIVVAMSGGVDSSVAAMLVRHLGYDAVGVTLQLYDQGEAAGRKGACCAGTDIRDARRVADHIGIPHYVLNYESRFKAAVIDTFVDSYLMGETPIPCVACNESVKFGHLADAAREMGAAALVTGHYVGWRRLPHGPALFRSADPDRDQSYFLFSTPRDELEFVRFPLGFLRKSEVRRIADDAGLIVADKPDSQDICFVPSGRYRDVIERLRPDAAQEGDIVHVDGRRLGRHRGILGFTVGQRRGLGVSAADALYVVALDAASRRVIVGPREALLMREVELRDVNWLADPGVHEFVAGGGRAFARLRSSQPPLSARVALVDGRTVVKLDDGAHGIARGQACVLYTSDSSDAQILGGGWIARAESRGERAVRLLGSRDRVIQ